MFRNTLHFSEQNEYDGYKGGRTREMKKIYFFMDWGIFGLRAYWYIVMLLQIIRDVEGGPPQFVALPWALAAFVIPLLFWLNERREYYGLAETVIGGSFYVYIILVTGEPSNFYMIPLLTIGYVSTRKSIWLAPAMLLLPYVGAILQVISFLEATGLIVDGLLFLSIGLWVNVIAHAYRKNSQLITEVEIQNRLLTQYAEQVESMTLLEERNRMSKELHDILGHSYISMIMGLDAAIALLDRNPELAKEKLLRLRNLTEQNIEDMRNAVHKMAEAEQVSVAQMIGELIEDFQEYTGTDIRYRISGSEQELSDAVRQAIIRMIQEAFTNAVKHGKATQIDLDIVYALHQISVEIRDNGKGGEEHVFGFGLTAMKSRIENVNGQLYVSVSSAKGTKIHCDIPLKKRKGDQT